MTDVFDIASELKIASVDPWVLRIPIAEPVVTPMGVVDSAIALFVKVTEQSGETGWGEVWCNFPRYGAPHRASAAGDGEAELHGGNHHRI